MNGTQRRTKTDGFQRTCSLLFVEYRPFPFPWSGEHADGFGQGSNHMIRTKLPFHDLVNPGLSHFDRTIGIAMDVHGHAPVGGRNRFRKELANRASEISDRDSREVVWEVRTYARNHDTARMTPVSAGLICIK